MSRLSIEIEPEQHKQIKMMATYSGLSIKDYILLKTLPRKTEAEDATEALMKHSKNADRLRAALAVDASEHVVFDSMEDLNDALGV